MRQLASRAMASRAFLLLQISLISLLSNEVTSLQLTRFAVPSPLYAGEYAECFCEFDEGHDKLKLLKWRINDTDLFHYRPSGSPRYEKLNQREEMPKVSGLSNGSFLLLENLRPEHSGDIICSLTLVAKGGDLTLYEKTAFEVRPGNRPEAWTSSSSEHLRGHWAVAITMVVFLLRH